MRILGSLAHRKAVRLGTLLFACPRGDRHSLPNRNGELGFWALRDILLV